ncbi:MAG: septal ring lytic transglycosylase RlpA family protein [Candidatus Pacebacteria bacterium]|nr:septal ring lytic transglycosylase RlpA family protein [Candidatus Paceibacterota bacterium]
MTILKKTLGWLSLVFLAVGLSACSSSNKQARYSPIEGLDTSPGTGYYKIGKPYQIEGVWYKPAIDYDYDEEGVSSWYGPGFHGKSTANGEKFDTNSMSAAHRTLPMPSFVRVTNLDNDRWVIARVNDRGPYVKTSNRILDISRRGAQLLGFIEKGTAPVRVQIMARESKKLADYMQRQRAFMPLVDGAADQMAEASQTEEAQAEERQALLESPEARVLQQELWNSIAAASILEQITRLPRQRGSFAWLNRIALPYHSP